MVNTTSARASSSCLGRLELGPPGRPRGLGRVVVDAVVDGQGGAQGRRHRRGHGVVDPDDGDRQPGPAHRAAQPQHRDPRVGPRRPAPGAPEGHQVPRREEQGAAPRERSPPSSSVSSRRRSARGRRRARSSRRGQEPRGVHEDHRLPVGQAGHHVLAVGPQRRVPLLRGEADDGSGQAGERRAHRTKGTQAGRLERPPSAQERTRLADGRPGSRRFTQFLPRRLDPGPTPTSWAPVRIADSRDVPATSSPGPRSGDPKPKGPSVRPSPSALRLLLAATWPLATGALLAAGPAPAAAGAAVTTTAVAPANGPVNLALGRTARASSARSPKRTAARPSTAGAARPGARGGAARRGGRSTWAPGARWAACPAVGRRLRREVPSSAAPSTAGASCRSGGLGQEGRGGTPPASPGRPRGTCG